MNKYFIATVNCANGNASVGTEWKETAIFDEYTTLRDVCKWAGELREQSHHLNILITPAQNAEEQSK